MATQFKVGDKVRIPASTNTAWEGEGEITASASGERRIALVRMTSGRFAGMSGGFVEGTIEPLRAAMKIIKVKRSNQMKIIKVKRSNQKTGLKVYGIVRGTSGKDYNFAYIRRSNFRGWICSCENFFFTMFKKNRNCKHIKFVREQVGRYASKA
jgi:hypothetical protein